MINVGEYNRLIPGHFAPQGLYLQDDQGDTILLPTKYIPQQLDMDRPLHVFVYLDNENRPIATTLKPFLQLNQFGPLRVREVSSLGAWLDWGVEKDILVPFGEQESAMEEGRQYLVYLYKDDKNGRLVATTRLSRYFQPTEGALEEGQEVDLLVWRGSDIGLKVVINQKYEGLIYRDEIFRRLHPGEGLKGFIKTVREDGKIDVVLEKPGYERIEPASQKLLDILKANGGFLPLHDKSDPQDIKHRLEMSKKTFKKALGALYKAKLVSIAENGIRVVE
jgi:hypothetical protein